MERELKGYRPMRLMLILLAALSGCMYRDEGKCEACSDSSSGTEYTTTTYRLGAAIAVEDRVEIALVRKTDDEPSTIELASVRNGVVDTWPMIVDGEPRRPRLAAIRDRRYVVWTTDREYGALLDADGNIRDDTVVDLGTRTVQLRPVGDTFLAVPWPPDSNGVVYGTTIDLDGGAAGTIELASDVDPAGFLDLADGALATRRVDGTLQITRFAGERRTETIALAGTVRDCNLVTLDSGDLFALVDVEIDQTWLTRIVHIGRDVSVDVMPRWVAVDDLVRVPAGILAVSYAPAVQTQLLDEAGRPVGPARSFSSREAIVVPTADDFAVVFAQRSDPATSVILMTTADRPAIEIARDWREPLGCGCRSANAGTTIFFVLVLLVGLSHRR